MLNLIVVVLTAWCAGRFALRREGRTSATVLETVLAPFGRVRTLPAGTELWAAKVYRYHPHVLTEPRRIWVGWWNCGRFPAHEERYYFARGASNLAIRVDAVR